MFKQKTAYEMRISDWSSDVCSSDLFHAPVARPALDILVDRRLVLHRAGHDLIDIVAEPALEGGQLQRCVFALMPDEQLRAPAPLALQRRIADLERLCSGMRPVGAQLLGRRSAAGTADVHHPPPLRPPPIASPAGPRKHGEAPLKLGIADVGGKER